MTRSSNPTKIKISGKRKDFERNEVMFEVGKHYRMANGVVVGPLEEGGNQYFVDEKIGGLHPMWFHDGTPDFFGGLLPEYSEYTLVEGAVDV